MRFIATFIFLFLAATCGAETMAKYVGVVPIKPPQTPANATVSITVNGTGAAALLYADNGTTRLTNPLRADAYGAFQFETTVGVYDITMTRADGTVSTWTKVALGVTAASVPWDTPGAIGSTTPNTGAFTTLSTTGAITSTLATGNPPLVIASTTLVPNLYVARAVLADSATTNANLTGPITSVGNATSIASQTGTGTKFVVDTSPTLVTPTLGTATATAITSGNLTDSALTSGRITTANTAGLLKDFAGLAIIGTPSATAPSTGTNGPGLSNGVFIGPADGVGAFTTIAAYGSGAAQTVGVIGYACQGTAASPGATISGDVSGILLRGHDGTNYTGTQAVFQLKASATWTPSSRPTTISFSTTPSGSTTLTAAGLIDNNQALVWGAQNVQGVSTYTTGTVTPRIQTVATNAQFASIGQALYTANANGPTHYIAKSRGASAGVAGVITTGDTLGTLSWQGDDGTNFIASSQIVGLSTGTIGTGQVPGILRMQTANSAGTMTIGAELDSSQVFCAGSGSANGGNALFTGGTVTPKLQVINSNLATTTWSNSTGASVLYFGKSRSATVNTMTLVNANDQLGTIDFQGADGTNFVSGAQILAQTTGTPASTRVGGQLLFKTGTDAAPTVMTTAETISNTQTVTWNGTTEASAIGTANCIDAGGLSVAKRSFLGTIGSTFKGNVNAGVQDGTAVAVGQVGEVISASVTSYTNYTSTATIQNLTSVSLTPGDWMEYATITYYGNSATNATDGEFVSYLDDTTASATGAVEGETLVYGDQPVTGTLHRTVNISFHENINGSKTKYLNGKAAFTVGNPQYTCSLKAVRIR